MPTGDKLSDFSGQFSRGWLYFLALVLLGALVAPLVWAHPTISRREKAVIILLGCLQTAAAIVALVIFIVWMFAYCRNVLGSGHMWPY